MSCFKKICTLSFAVTLCFSASACSGSDTETDSAISSQEITSDTLNSENHNSNTQHNFRQTAFSEKNIPRPQNFWDFQAMNYVAPLDSYFLIYNDMDYNLILRVWSGDFSQHTDTTLFENNGKCSFISSVSDDGTITVFTAEKKSLQSADNADEYFKHSGYFYSVTQFGNDLQQCFSAEIPDMDYYYSSRGSIPLSITRTSDNQFIMSTNHEVLVIGNDGTVAEIPDTTGFSATGISSDGRIAVAEYKTLSFIDEHNNITESIPLSDAVNGDLLSGDDEFILYIPCEGGIYGLDENYELTLVADYSASYLPMGFIQNVQHGDGKDFLIYVNENGNMKLSRITPRPDDYSLNREKITLACTFMNVDDRILANEFNKRSDSFFLEVKENAQPDDIKMDILAGNPPDIIKYNDIGFMRNLVNMGGVADLYPLMEQFVGLKKDDILGNVISTLEYNGGLYAISDKFEISFIVADKSFIGGEYSDWSFDKFLSLYNSRPSDMLLSYDYYTRSPDNIFRRFCSGVFADNLSAWIDEANLCRFDSDEFTALLELCRNAKVADENVSSLDVALSLKNRTGMIAFADCCRCINDFRMLNVYQLGLDGLSFLSYPGTDSDGTTGFYELYSITGNTDCKDGAWEFISYIMSEEHQSAENSAGELFTLKNAFDNNLSLNTERQGAENTIAEIGFDGFTFTCNELLTQKEADIFRNLVNSCTSLSCNSKDISNICNEESSLFINGEITARQCADMIQNRVSVYLSEQG